MRTFGAHRSASASVPWGRASLPIQVRPPRISLSLRTLGRPQPGRRFTLQLTATTEAARQLVVEGLPLTRRRCPVNYAAEELVHIVDRVLDGGPWLIRANLMPLRAGDYIFCAWADAPGDEGLYPEARASLVLRIGAATRSHRPQGRRGRARS